MRGLRTLTAVFALFGAESVAAETFCADVEALSGTGVEHGLALPADIVRGIPSSERAGECRTSRALSGASHVHCSWSFDYRSDAATEVFEGMTAAVTACLGPEATMISDSSVNHPDAYSLRMFDRAGQEFAVSVKDKGALKQTLVFVRVEQR